MTKKPASTPTPPPGKTREELLSVARDLPETTGVYLMKDVHDRVLYVGKAKNLRTRVGSYFQASTDLGPRKQGMIPRIHAIDVIECEGEWEALLTEARLIKDIRPSFNTIGMDDRTFPYLVITLKDDFPGVYITRTPAEEQYAGAKVIGPFTSVSDLHEAVHLLQRVFQFRTCTMNITDGDPRNARFRPCLLANIERCTAPCGNRVSLKSYRRDIQRFLRFLGSRRSRMISSLQKDMRDASAGQRFEEAAVLRNQIRAIEKLDERAGRDRDAGVEWQPEVTVFATDPAASLRSLQESLAMEEPIRCMEAIDIAHLQGGETVGSKVCFIDGRPFRDGYRRYRIRASTNDDYLSIREVIGRRYREAGKGEELYPDLILIDGGLGQLSAALEAFQLLDMQPPMVVSLAKREELVFVQGRREPLQMKRNDPGLRLCQAIRDEAHRFAQHYHHLLRSRHMLDES